MLATVACHDHLRTIWWSLTNRSVFSRYFFQKGLIFLCPPISHTLSFIPWEATLLMLKPWKERQHLASFTFKGQCAGTHACRDQVQKASQDVCVSAGMWQGINQNAHRVNWQLYCSNTHKWCCRTTNEQIWQDNTSVFGCISFTWNLIWFMIQYPPWIIKKQTHLHSNNVRL